jgi:hypothetical protein
MSPGHGTLHDPPWDMKHNHKDHSDHQNKKLHIPKEIGKQNDFEQVIVGNFIKGMKIVKCMA